MKTSFFSLVAIFLLMGVSLAQSPPEPAQAPSQGTPANPSNSAASNSSAQTPAPNGIAPGTVIPVELSKSLDSKKSKANDKIEAKISMDVLSHGQIVVPRNSKVVGHVTEAKAHSKESPESMVGVAFDRIIMKDGHDLPLQAAVQAIGRPLQSSPTFTGGGNEPMSGTAGGMPPSGGSSRGSMGGTTTGGPTYPSSYPTYPTGSASGSPSDNTGSTASSVTPLGPTSQGVIGIRGLSLNSSGQASVVASSSENVHLDSGTQLILRVQ